MKQGEIEKYRHDLEVVRNTASQVIKDFGMSGIDIRFSGDPVKAYAELKLQVKPALEKLYKTNTGAFMGLLYRIDVEEKKVKALQSAGFFEGLCDLILEREFVKVLIRKLYTHKGVDDNRQEYLPE